MAHRKDAGTTRMQVEEDAGGTALMGYVDITYEELVHGLGRPPRGAISDKVQAEWISKFEDGCLATIYDYRDGAPPDPAREAAGRLGGFFQRHKRAANRPPHQVS